MVPSAQREIAPLPVAALSCARPCSQTFAIVQPDIAVVIPRAAMIEVNVSFSGPYTVHLYTIVRPTSGRSTRTERYVRKRKLSHSSANEIRRVGWGRNERLRARRRRLYLLQSFDDALMHSDRS